MRQTIPFKKDITFKTKIGELTAIALDNDLTLKGEDLIVGNFYISGTYKMLETSTIEEEYSYKIPCEIAINEEYDTYNATIDIDDFYYEIINDEILRINIVVVINNLERKEIVEDEEEELETDDEIIEELSKKENREVLEKLEEEEVNILDEIPEIPRESKSFLEVKEEVKNQKDTYLTYRVYMVKDDDTLEQILEKYEITKEQLADYNNLEEFAPGVKLVIPSFND